MISYNSVNNTRCIHNVLFDKTMEGNVKAIHCNIEMKMYSSCMKALKPFVFVQISSSFTSS